METTLNPTNEFKLTTKSLGIAEAKAKDLSGYILNPRDLEDAAIKILIAVGIAPEEIRCVKVGGTKEKNLRVIVEIYAKAFKKKEKEKKTALISFDDLCDDDEDELSYIDPKFFAALHNKVYHGKKKHLNMRKIDRTVPGEGKRQKVIQFEFDPQIFIAFVYDIPFTDRFYKISVVTRGLMNKQQLNKKYDSKKERKKKELEIAEWQKDGILPCTVYVTFANTDGTDRGFHPEQVDEYFDSERDNKNN